MAGSTNPSREVVALFNASDDTVDMIKNLLVELGSGQTLIACHFADLKQGVVNFEKYIEKHNPELVIFDITPPYDANWRFFQTVRDAPTMRGRGLVLTTTNKSRLDEVMNQDSYALEIVGKPADLQRLQVAIQRETDKAAAARMATG